MTDRPDNRDESTGVADLRAELKNELLRAACANQDRRSMKRRFAPLAFGVALVAVPATFAVAELSSDDRTEFAVPAPAPIFAPDGAYANCPNEVQDLIIKLDGDLDAYAKSSGYPVEGCPTAEELGEVLDPVEASEPKEGVVTLELPGDQEETLQSPERVSGPGKGGPD